VVVEGQPLLGALEAEAVQPTRRKPARMRERDGEVVQRSLAIDRVCRTCGERQRGAIAGDRAQHRIDESARAALPGPSRHVYRIVDDGGGGNTCQVEQLVGSDAEDLGDFRIEPLDTALREMSDDVIDRRPPALHTGRDLGGQCPVPFVGQ
jgi:hypothetical protein